MSCSICGKDGHNKRACPYVDRKKYYCSVCGYKAVDFEVNPENQACPACHLIDNIINPLTEC